MKRVQSVCTILILSIACSMPAMVSGGTLQSWDTFWVEFQSWDRACKAKLADDPNFSLFVSNVQLVDLADQFDQLSGGVECVVKTSIEAAPTNIRYRYKFDLVNPNGATERICKGKGKTGADGTGEIACDVKPEVINSVLLVQSRDALWEGSINWRSNRKLDEACIWCGLFFCRRPVDECLTDEKRNDLAAALAILCDNEE